MNAEDSERISHRNENKTQININILHSCASPYLAKFASQCAISTVSPHTPSTTDISSPAYAHLFSSWRNWSPAKRSYNYKWGLHPSFYLKSNLFLGWFGSFISVCSFRPQIKQQNSSSNKRSVFVSKTQKTMVQSECYVLQVNNRYIGNCIPGIIIKKATFPRLDDILLLSVVIDG